MAVPRSVELKLQRAEEHIAVLDAEVRAFLGDEPYAARRSVEQGGLEHIVSWTRYTEPPSRLGLIAGDAIHNIRSSLDHMVMALAQAGAAAAGASLSEEEERNLQFPITMSPSKFKKSVNNGAVYRVPPAAAGFIEDRQPYNAVPEHPRRIALFEIGKFDNVDKHRALTVALLSTSVVRVSWPMELSDTPMLTLGEDLDFGPNGEIARFVFSKPYSEEEVPLEYRWGFTLAGAVPGIHDIRFTLDGFVKVARFTVSQLGKWI